MDSKRDRKINGKSMAGLAVLAFLVVTLTYAQPKQPAPAQQTDPSQIAPGARLLVRLQDRLSTKENKAGQVFSARTIEPLSAADGTLLRPGAEVRGHIDKVTAAGKTGRARLWLTFDDIRTPAGWRPLVADLVDLPGIHSIRVAYDHENEIEATSSKRDREIQAAAAGALAGAAPGIADNDKQHAALGAAAGAAAAFMAASGLGQEITLEKDTKLELVLGRPLYLSGS
jgi:hypothetical protein